MAKILYYFLVLLSALLLYNQFFITGKLMSNGKSEKVDMGIITLGVCLVTGVITYFYFSGQDEKAHTAVYIGIGILICITIFALMQVRWN